MILECLSLCFIHDKEDFIDTNKFEKLVDPLVNLFDVADAPYLDYQFFVD